MSAQTLIYYSAALSFGLIFVGLIIGFTLLKIQGGIENIVER